MRARPDTAEQRKLQHLREFYAAQLRLTHLPNEAPCADGVVRYFSDPAAYERAIGEAVERKLRWHLRREQLHRGQYAVAT